MLHGWNSRSRRRALSPSGNNCWPRAVFAAALLLFGSLAQGTNRPNILFIVVDDLNHWVNHLGRNNQSITPNIDRLAAQGVTFTNAHAAAPACNPSRAAMLSGQRPWTSAVYTNDDPWKQHIPEGLSLSAQFLRAGYRVVGAGKIYHGESHYESEWTSFMDSRGTSAHGVGVDTNEGFHKPVRHDIADSDLRDWKTIDWCIDQLKQPHEEPLFLACGLHKPHLPFVVPLSYYEMFPLDRVELPPYREDDLVDIPKAGVRIAKPEGDHERILRSGRWKSVIQAYLASVAYTDMNIGRLLDALESSDRRDNTIILLVGDNGWHFGEKHHWRKFTLWEEGTRVPFVWVAPGITIPRSRSNRPVDLMSIYPTLCELASIPVPSHVEGVSILSLLADPEAPWEPPAITTHGFGNHAVRSERWRYIRYADKSEELYDHEADPYEWTNLASRPEHTEVINELEGWLPKKEAMPIRTNSIPTRFYVLALALVVAVVIFAWRRRIGFR